jgi:Tfp pilus assembly pilus retraction ATPase PilT
MRDRETIEMVLEAADMGLIVFSTLNTIDASKTIERIAGRLLPKSRNQYEAFRQVIPVHAAAADPARRRLRPAPVFEIVKSNSRTRECVEKGSTKVRRCWMIKSGEAKQQYFDSEIAVGAQRSGGPETGASFASNAAVLGQELAK